MLARYTTDVRLDRSSGTFYYEVDRDGKPFSSGSGFASSFEAEAHAAASREAGIEADERKEARYRR